MAQRVKKETANKGFRGTGSLVKLSSTRCRVDFETGEQKPIEISETSVPEILNTVLEKMPDNAKVNVEVTLDDTETKIMFVRPLTGTFDFKFVKFYAPRDQPPVIEVKKGKGNSTYGLFSAVLEVQKKSGAANELWKGARYNVFFFDKFAKTDDGKLAVYADGTDNANLLNDFLDVIGVGSQDIEYSTNPLPQIEKLALQLDKVFSADVRKTVAKDGSAYANITMFHTSLGDEFDFDKVEEKELPEANTTHPALDE